MFNAGMGLLLRLVPSVPDVLVNIVLIGANGVNFLVFFIVMLGGPIRYVHRSREPGVGCVGRGHCRRVS